MIQNYFIDNSITIISGINLNTNLVSIFRNQCSLLHYSRKKPHWYSITNIYSINHSILTCQPFEYYFQITYNVINV